MNEERLIELMKQTFPTKGEINTRFNDIERRLDLVNESLDELKATSNTVDKILEAHPVERIVRLEQHNRLPNYVHALVEE